MSEYIEQKLYGGKVTVTFKTDGHAYYVNGNRPVSVTALIGVLDKSRALIPWAVGETVNYIVDKWGTNGLTKEQLFTVLEESKSAHKIKKQEAAKIGTITHDWIEKYIKGEQPAMPERKESQIGVNAFLDWVSANKVKVLSSERIVYSKKYDYVGKMDIEAKVNGELCLIDIKTSNGIYNSYNLQTAAYVKADEEESKRKYNGRWIVRLAKETEEEYISRMITKGKTEVSAYVPFEAKFLDITGKEMKRDYDAFLACLTLHSWNKETDVWLK
jgi:hypothetical protein